MRDAETTVIIDLDKMPSGIGIMRDRVYKSKRVYSPPDVPKVLAWIDQHLSNAPNDAKVLIIGGFPTWMSMEVGIELYDNEKIGVLYQGYHNTTPTCVFDKNSIEVY